MPRHNLHTLPMQIGRLLDQGQPFFAVLKVQDWLRERDFDPQEFEISFKRKQNADATSPQPPEIVLRRRDGQDVDPWLLTEINRHL